MEMLGKGWVLCSVLQGSQAEQNQSKGSKHLLHHATQRRPNV